LACLSALESARRKCLVALDDGGRILGEYMKHLSPSGQPGAGDLFVKWLWENQANPRRCERVKITPRPQEDDNFEEFPDDPDLEDFDRADRKFVAVARSSHYDPTVLNATDTDWWIFRKPLAKHGVRIEFLCPNRMQKPKRRR